MYIYKSINFILKCQFWVKYMYLGLLLILITDSPDRLCLSEINMSIQRTSLNYSFQHKLHRYLSEQRWVYSFQAHFCCLFCILYQIWTCLAQPNKSKRLNEFSYRKQAGVRFSAQERHEKLRNKTVNEKFRIKSVLLSRNTSKDNIRFRFHQIKCYQPSKKEESTGRILKLVIWL